MAGLPTSSSLPGASWVSVADVVGAVCTPVGQHVGVTWRNGWRRTSREIWHLGVAMKGSQLSGTIWGQDVGGLRRASYLGVTIGGDLSRCIRRWRQGPGVTVGASVQCHLGVTSEIEGCDWEFLLRGIVEGGTQERGFSGGHYLGVFLGVVSWL